MKSFLKLCNLSISIVVGSLIGLLSTAIIAVFVRFGTVARADYDEVKHLIAARDLIAAGECLDRSATSGWNPPTRHLEAASLFLMAGAPESAEESYRVALASGAPRDECFVGLARAAAMAGRDPMDLYRQAMRATPGDPWPAAEAALHLAANGRSSDAVAILDEAAKLRWVADPSLEAARAQVMLASNNIAAAQAALTAGKPVAINGTRGAGEYFHAAAILSVLTGDEQGGREFQVRADAECYSHEAALRRLVLPAATYAIWAGEIPAARGAATRVGATAGPLSREEAISRLFPNMDVNSTPADTNARIPEVNR